MTKASGFAKLFRLPFLPLGILTVVSAFMLAENYNLIQLFWTSLSYFFLHCFVASMNNTHDVSFDSVSKVMNTQNPLVNNELTLREAQIMIYLTPALAIVTGLFVGSYWLALVLIGIGLSVLYDIKPFRMKDKPAGILFPPLHLVLPFLFAYLSQTSSFGFSLSFIFCLIFLFFSMLTSLRHVPDYEKDVQMGVQNFTSKYSLETTKRLELSVSVILPVILTLAIILNYLSILGLPLLIIATVLRLNLLSRPVSDMKNPVIWTKYAKYVTISNVVLLLSVVGIRV